MKKLWAKILKYSKSKYREEHLKTYSLDIKCPNCNEWFSISGIDYKHERVAEYDWGDSCKCGQCGHISYWNLCAFPFPVLCDDRGTPLQTSREQQLSKEIK